MEQVTQSNAANAEESASAAEELSAQAEELNRMVNDLKVLVGGRKDDHGERVAYRPETKPHKESASRRQANRKPDHAEPASRAAKDANEKQIPLELEQDQALSNF